MTDISKMTLNQMIEAGVPMEQITAAIENMKATKEKEKQEKIKAEVAARARQDEIVNARRQYKKAYAKWYKALTGEDMSEQDMAEYEAVVILPMEKLYTSNIFAKPTTEKKKCKCGSAEDALIAAIFDALK